MTGLNVRWQGSIDTRKEARSEMDMETQIREALARGELYT